ncbi:efflux RND transporter periplasmic adaptor subunit [Aquisphaera insulae]|uniref:efflux RND transporter periplasmic adaptor subunit n=1 Tax=Aquisphaera insulae TaxID=2712864 RepID=UPI00196AECC6|nr:HlyD family efflux transporter periplasmic adaptor subunit [Aquisphaera insulae]
MGRLVMLAGLAGAGGLGWAWYSGYRPAMLRAESPDAALPLVEIDQGDVVEYIVENGALESASNTVVKCEVEALLGMVGGSSSSTTGAAKSTSGSASGTSGTTAASGTSGSGTSGGTAAAATTTASSKAKSKASGSSSKSSGASTAGKSGSSSSGGSSSGGSGGGASSSGGSGGDSSGAATTASAKPTIRSFSYMVTPHTPLRGASKSTTTTAAKGVQSSSSGGGGGGGGGRGGRGGRGGGGGGMMDEEKPGSTRIVSILPDGSKVRKGEVVCELDSSTFQDELKAQLIRYAQAKAWVDQARSIHDVTEITLREYRDGIFPQDLQLLRQYIKTCEITKDQAARNLAWSREVTKKGMRASSQLRADELSDQQAGIALEEAQGMLERLERYTGPKNLKQLEAKLKAIDADKSTQEAALELEKQRLARLQKCIDNCVLRAPMDGQIVYKPVVNSWGRVEAQIEQGVTVREDQPIFELPDPRNMRVKVRINETKIGLIKTGQSALIRLDAFPDRTIRGVVETVTAISTPVNGPFSDVRIYFANVKIDADFDDLRPGLTAEVFFKSDVHPNVTRIPLTAVRKIGDRHFAAVHQQGSPGRDRPWEWQRIELGASDPDYVEVVSGLKQGDRVVANPKDLPAPVPSPVGPDSGAASAVAVITPGP